MVLHAVHTLFGFANTGDVFEKKVDASSPRSQKTAADKLFDDVLKCCPENPYFNIDQFEALHCPSKPSQQVTGNQAIINSLKFWICFFDTLKTKWLSQIPIQVCIGQLTQILNVLNQSLAAQEVLGNTINGTLGKRIPKDLHEEVVGSLNRNGRVYLISGFQDESRFHSFPIKYDPSGQVVALNAGKQKGQKPVCDITETEIVTSYQSLPIPFSLQEVNGDHWIQHFRKMYRIYHETPLADCPKYSAMDIYGCILLLGNKNPTYDKKLEAKIAPHRHEDDNPSSAIELIVIDILMDLKFSRKTIEHFLFYARLYSILGAYRTLNASKLDPCVAGRLKSAGEAFLGYMSHLHPTVITNDELIVAKKGADHLMALCQSTGDKTYTTLPLLQLSQCQFPTSFPIPALEASPPVQSMPFGTSSPSMETQPKFSLDESVDSLQNLNRCFEISNKLVGSKNDEQFFNSVYQLFFSFPIPGHGNPYWTRIPQSEHQRVIEQLNSLVLSSLQRSSQVAPYQKQLIVLTAYAIIDCICRSNPKCRLNGYHSQFWGKELKAHPKILSGEPSRRYHDLRKYFDSVEHKNLTPLFCFEKSFNLDTESAFRNGQLVGAPRMNSKIGHLSYLSQFYAAAANNGLGHFKNNQEVLFAELWIDAEAHYLPLEFHGLRQISLISRLLIESPDFKFSSMVKSQSQSVIPLFFKKEESPKKQTLTRGFVDPVSERKEEPVLDPFASIPEDMRLIIQFKSYPELQITSLLDWIRGNYHRLHSDNGLKLLVETVLFDSGELPRKLAAYPGLFQDCRKVMREVIEYYQHHLHESRTLLFFLKIGVLLETHFKNSSGVYHQSETLGFYLKCLENLNSHKISEKTAAEIIALELIALCTHTELTPELVKKILKKAFEFRFHYQEISTLKEEVWSAFASLRKGLQKHLSNPAIYQEVSAEVINSFLAPQKPRGSGSKTEKPTERPFDVSLDLTKAEASIKGKEIGVFPISQYASLLDDRMQQELKGLKGYWASMNEWCSLSGNVRVIVVKKNSTDIYLELHFTISCFETFQWFLYLSPETISQDQALNQIIRSLPESGDYIFCKGNDEGNKKLIYFTNPQRNKIYGVIDTSTRVAEVYKTMENGQRLPIQLINMKQLETGQPELYHFITLGLGDDLPVVAFWDKTRQIITSLHYKTLGLTFQSEHQDGESVMTCQYGRRAAQQSLETLNGFEGLIVLQPDSLHRKVIIPICSLSQSFTSGVTQVGLEAPLELRRTEKYCVYSLYPQRNSLETDCSFSNAYLMVIYFMLGNYDKAHYYLRKIANILPYDDEWCLFKQLQKTTDRSNRALVFHLHLALCIFENYQQTLHSASGTHRPKNWQSDFDNYKIFVAEILEDYLRVYNKGPCQVSWFHQLELDQEIRILNNLRYSLTSEQISSVEEGRYTDVEGHWSPILEARFQLLNSPEKKVEFKFAPPSLMIYPQKLLISKVQLESLDILKTLIPDVIIASPSPKKDFVRIRGDEILGHLFLLYKRAVEAKDDQISEIDFDIFYLMQSATSANHLQIWATLLAIIRKHPQAFRDIDFPQRCPKAALIEIIRVAEQLVKKTQELLSGPSKIEKTSLVYEKSSFKSCLKINGQETAKASPPIELDLKEHQEALSILANPLGEIKTDYFERTPRAAGDPPIPFVLDAFKEVAATKTEKKLLATMAQGNNPPQTIQDDIISLKADRNIAGLKDKLGELRGKDKQHQLMLAREITARTSRRPSETTTDKVASNVLMADYKYHMRKVAGHERHLTASNIILEAILTKDLSIIYKCNPTLTSTQINGLIASSLAYLSHSVRMKLIDHVLALIEKAEKSEPNQKEKVIREIGSLLEWKCDIDVNDLPEIYVYAFMADTIIPQKVIEVLKKAEEFPKDARRICHQLGSAVNDEACLIALTAISMAKARRLGGLSACIIPAKGHLTPSNLQGALVQGFNQNVAFMNVRMDDSVSSIEAAALVSVMDKCLIQRKHLLLTEDSFNALVFKYHGALKRKDMESVRYLSMVLEDFGRKSTVIMPVSEQPIQKLGLGIETKLPKDERRMFITLYRALIGAKSTPLYIDRDRLLSEAAGLRGNLQTLMPAETKQRVKEALADYLVKDERLQTVSGDHQWIKAFWLDSSKPIPEAVLKHANPKAQHLVMSLRIYFANIYDLVMSMKGGCDYVRDKGSEFYIPTGPCHPSLHLVLALTIQGTLQFGLSDEQAEKLINRAIAAYKQELLFDKSTPFTDMYTAWNEWIAGSDLPSLDKVQTDDIKQMGCLTHFLKTHLHAILWYLDVEILPKLKFDTETFDVNPLYYQDAFAACQMITESKPIEELVDSKEAQNALIEVKRDVQALSTINSSLVVIFSAKLGLFFDHFIDRQMHLKVPLTAFRDLGSLFSNTPNVNVAREFLAFSRKYDLGYHGVIYFEDNQDTTLKERPYLLLLSGNHPIELDPQAIEKSLEPYRRQYSGRLKIMTYYDSSHASISGLFASDNEGVIISVNDATDLTTLAKASSGCSNVAVCLNDKVHGALESQLRPMPMDPKALLFCLFRNFCKKIEQRIAFQACRRIERSIWSKAMRTLIRESKDPAKQIKIYNSFEKAFYRSYDHSLIRILSKLSPSANFTSFLWGYAEACYKQYSFAESFSRSSKTGLELVSIIDEADSFVEQTHSEWVKLTLFPSQTTKKLCHSPEKREVNISPVHSLSPPRSPVKNCNLYSQDLLKRIIGCCKSAREAFESHESSSNRHLSSTLYYSPEAIFQRKSTSYYLLIKPTQTQDLYAFVISDSEADHFLQQFKEHSSHSHLVTNYQLALVTSMGIIADEAPPRLAFSSSEWTHICQSNAYQNLCADIALLNGNIAYPRKLIERLQVWNGFPRMWKEKILAFLPMMPKENREFIEKLIPKRLKKKPNSG